MVEKKKNHVNFLGFLGRWLGDKVTIMKQDLEKQDKIQLTIIIYAVLSIFMVVSILYNCFSNPVRYVSIIIFIL